MTIVGCSLIGCMDTLNIVSVNSVCLLQTISVMNCIENVVDIDVF